MEEVQKSVQSNSERFKNVYKELIAECVLRRNTANISQKDVADMLKVDRRKISELEAGNGGVGLLLNYADIFDIETYKTLIIVDRLR